MVAWQLVLTLVVFSSPALGVGVDVRKKSHGISTDATTIYRLGAPGRRFVCMHPGCCMSFATGGNCRGHARSKHPDWLEGFGRALGGVLSGPADWYEVMDAEAADELFSLSTEGLAKAKKAQAKADEAQAKAAKIEVKAKRQAEKAQAEAAKKKAKAKRQAENAAGVAASRVQNAAMGAANSELHGVNAAAGQAAYHAYLDGHAGGSDSADAGRAGMEAGAAAARAAIEAARTHEDRLGRPAEAASRGDAEAMEAALTGVRSELGLEHYGQVAEAAALELLPFAQGNPEVLIQLERMTAAGGVLAPFMAPAQCNLRAAVRDGIHALQAERAERAAQLHAREEDALLITAYNDAADAAGLPHWSGDEEYSRFSNLDDVASWGDARRLWVLALLPTLAIRIPGLIGSVPTVEVELEQERLKRLVPDFFESLPTFEQHVLSSAEAARQGAARTNFAESLPLEARQPAVCFSAVRFLDTMLGQLMCIDSTDNPVLVCMVSAKHPAAYHSSPQPHLIIALPSRGTPLCSPSRLTPTSRPVTLTSCDLLSQPPDWTKR